MRPNDKHGAEKNKGEFRRQKGLTEVSHKKRHDHVYTKQERTRAGMDAKHERNAADKLHKCHDPRGNGDYGNIEALKKGLRGLHVVELEPAVINKNCTSRKAQEEKGKVPSLCAVAILLHRK